MAITNNVQGFLFIQQSGKLARPNGLGLIKCGWSKLGEYFKDAGIYRRDGRWHKMRTVRMVHYRPTNNRMENQQAWRGTFRSGMEAWSALTAEQKAEYKKLGTRNGIGPCNYFLSRYLRNLL